MWCGTDTGRYGTTDPFAKDRRAVVSSEYAVKGQQSETPLSKAYFSAANARLIQNELRYRVHQLTGRVIGRQSEIDLFAVMKSMYLLFGVFRDDMIAAQIRDLDDRVLAEVVPLVVSEMKMRAHYIKDISTPPGAGLTQPESTSRVGSRNDARNVPLTLDRRM